MTKRVHPAQTARKLVGVASGVALVGIVTGFQLGANAQESQQAPVATGATVPATATTEPAAPAAAPEAVPAPATPQQNTAPVQQQAPAPVAPAEAPAPAAPAPAAPVDVAPAPAAPAAPVVNGTTGGSG